MGKLFYRRFTAVLLLLLATSNLLAQGNSATRTTIDSLRWGFDYKSAEAFRRANQAKQLDSTYYVSHLIEGFHYYDKAEEHTGLARATLPLRKALRYFKKENGRIISRRFTPDEIRRGAWNDILKQIDYLTLAGTLVECFQSLEMPDSAFNALKEMQRDNLPFDFRSHQGLAWLYFRSRIYSKEKYPFLKGSIEENIKTAFAYTDSLEMKYRKNVGYLRSSILGTFPEGSAFYDFFKGAYVEQPKSFVSNTRGILYGYELQPEKAAKFFKQMRGDDNLAKMVNLGYTYHSNIDLRTSEDYFANVPELDAKTRGGHWQGYSTIYVYKAKPFEGAAKLYEERDKAGFTIGYGWDNLCLARLYLYSGMVAEANLALNKAEDFSEVHFNTSFREDQYRFMLRTLRLLEHDYQLRAHTFETGNPWLTLSWWREMPRLSYLKFSGIYELANELALNPEREIVYYHLFHSESIIGFDELWNIIRNYDQGFFRKLFTRIEQEDPRKNTGRYYQYFRGKLLYEEGLYERAYNKLNDILADKGLDQEYEKLLIARIHETLTHVSEQEDWLPQRAYHLSRFYQTFPQLVPYSGLRMGFKTSWSDGLLKSNKPEIQAILRELQECNIDFTATEENYPELQLELAEDGKIAYAVTLFREVFASGRIDPERPGGGKRLAYQLFKIPRR